MRPGSLDIDRPLTDDERSSRLYQKKKMKLKSEYLYDNLSVIKLNSTYLETVDKYYEKRGFLSFWFLILSGVLITTDIFLFIIGALLNGTWGMFFLVCFFQLPIFIGFWFIFKPDFLCYTHYPIRFNRKNKKVYAFTRDQGMLIVDWDSLFFTLDYFNPTNLPIKEYAIRGHILSEDNESIINSFELGISGYSKEVTISYWEFIRRYMEEGAKSVFSIVEYCLPLSNKKANLKYEFLYPIAHNFTATPRFLLYLEIPFSLLKIIGRLFAMSTSKKFVWSDEINEECQVNADDKINLDESINKSWSWKWGWTKKPWWKRMADPKLYDPFINDNYI